MMSTLYRVQPSVLGGRWEGQEEGQDRQEGEGSQPCDPEGSLVKKKVKLIMIGCLVSDFSSI